MSVTWGTSGAHGGKRLVPRGVEESDVLAGWQGNVVCADVLGDSA